MSLKLVNFLRINAQINVQVRSSYLPGLASPLHSPFPIPHSHNYYSVFQYLICCRRRPRLIQNVAIFLIKGCKRNQNHREPVTPAGHPTNYMARTACLCASVYLYIYHICVCVCVKYAMIYASMLNVAEVFALILRNCCAASAACSVQHGCGNCGQC